MHPAPSDELFRQHSRSLGDNSPLSQDPYRTPQEHESGGRSKKKGKGSKGKDKVNKSAAKILPSEEL